jgi:hypothetical protein
VFANAKSCSETNTAFDRRVHASVALKIIHESASRGSYNRTLLGAGVALILGFL